jgi:hypothetical protein
MTSYASSTLRDSMWRTESGYYKGSSGVNPQKSPERKYMYPVTESISYDLLEPL